MLEVRIVNNTDDEHNIFKAELEPATDEVLEVRIVNNTDDEHTIFKAERDSAAGEVLEVRIVNNTDDEHIILLMLNGKQNTHPEGRSKSLRTKPPGNGAGSNERKKRNQTGY